MDDRPRCSVVTSSYLERHAYVTRPENLASSKMAQALLLSRQQLNTNTHMREGELRVGDREGRPGAEVLAVLLDLLRELVAGAPDIQLLHRLQRRQRLLPARGRPLGRLT